MTPDEELDHLDTELERMRRLHPRSRGVLRLSNECLRRCSQWKWGQHGWILTEQQACGIMNGNERERRSALLSVLQNVIEEIEIVSDLEAVEILPRGLPSPPDPGSADA